MNEMKAAKLEWAILFFVFMLVVVGMILAATNLQAFEGFYVREDGPIEWMTVLALLTGAGIALKRSIRLRSKKGKFFSLCLIILAAIFVFGAGEEISWGQRIFNIESPEFFKTHNSQEETNLHNLIVKGKKINKIVFGTMLGIFVALYLLVLPVLYRKNEKVRKLVDRFAMPVADKHHIACYLLLFLFVSITPSGKKGELLEFGSCFIFVLLTWRPYNKDLYL